MMHMVLAVFKEKAIVDIIFCVLISDSISVCLIYHFLVIRMDYAIKTNPNISVKFYKMSLSLTD